MFKRLKNIAPIFAIITLVIFAMAITPWGALHHHAEVKVEVEKHCNHQFHLKAQEDICLLCKAHFEKDFVQEAKTFTVYLFSKKISRSNPEITDTYVRLIATSLRGPPAMA